MEEKLSQKEFASKKEEKKYLKKYTILKYGKITTFILLGIFVVAAICFGLGLRSLNSSMDIVGEETQTNMGVTVMLIFGAVGLFVLPFFIFRRFSLIAILIGVALWDAGIVFPGMFLEGESYALGGVLVLYGVVALLIGERRRNKKKGNYKINLNQEMVESIIRSSESDVMMDTLDGASYRETSYKASLYFTLSIMLVCMTGIGLILPFGKWAYNYNKYLFFITSEWDFVSEEKESMSKGKNNEPFRGLLDGLIYIDEKPFKIVKINGVASYDTRARASMVMGFPCVFIGAIIWEMNAKRRSSIMKRHGSLGELTFSSQEIAESNPELAEVFVAYAKSQTKENMNELLEGLNTWMEESHARTKAELERINRYEEERDRTQGLYAEETSVLSDGKDFYIKGYDAEGNQKEYKLDEYNDKTNIGTYTDENGKKITIKNNN